ncbi:MAG: Mn-Zn_transporter_SitD, partial [uncultured Acidimicrobiales bacterium]
EQGERELRLSVLPEGCDRGCPHRRPLRRGRRTRAAAAPAVLRGGDVPRQLPRCGHRVGARVQHLRRRHRLRPARRAGHRGARLGPDARRLERHRGRAGRLLRPRRSGALLEAERLARPLRLPRGPGLDGDHRRHRHRRGRWPRAAGRALRTPQRAGPRCVRPCGAGSARLPDQAAGPRHAGGDHRGPGHLRARRRHAPFGGAADGPGARRPPVGGSGGADDGSRRGDRSRLGPGRAVPLGRLRHRGRRCDGAHGLDIVPALGRGALTMVTALPPGPPEPDRGRHQL